MRWARMTSRWRPSSFCSNFGAGSTFGEYSSTTPSWPSTEMVVAAVARTDLSTKDFRVPRFQSGRPVRKAYTVPGSRAERVNQILSSRTLCHGRTP